MSRQLIRAVIHLDLGTGYPVPTKRSRSVWACQATSAKAAHNNIWLCLNTASSARELAFFRLEKTAKWAISVSSSIQPDAVRRTTAAALIRHKLGHQQIKEFKKTSRYQIDFSDRACGSVTVSYVSQTTLLTQIGSPLTHFSLLFTPCVPMGDQRYLSSCQSVSASVPSPENDWHTACILTLLVLTIVSNVPKVRPGLPTMKSLSGAAGITIKH